MNAHDVCRSTAAAALLFLGTGCGLLPPTRPPEPIPVTEDTVLLTVPVVPQGDDHECGLATLATLCGYHGVALPPDVEARLLAIAEEREGLSGGELRQALRDLGLEAYLFRGTLGHGDTDLYRHVDLGRPPLVMIASDSDTYHYCLFTGYDRPAGVVYLYDPRRGHLRMPAAEFEPLWRNAGHFTLLALPHPGGEPPVARGM